MDEQITSSPQPSPPEEEREKNQEIQPKFRLIQWQWPSPPGEGESSAVFFASHRLVSQSGVAASAALLRQKAVAGHLRTPRNCIVPAQEREKRRGLRQLNVAAQMDFEAEFGEHGCFDSAGAVGLARIGRIDDLVVGGFVARHHL